MVHTGQKPVPTVTSEYPAYSLPANILPGRSLASRVLVMYINPAKVLPLLIYFKLVTEGNDMNVFMHLGVPSVAKLLMLLLP